MSDNSVQCVVTSPPYWGLRKYSGEQELIWGDNHCDHQFDLPSPPRRKRNEADIKDPHSKQMTHTANAYNATDTNFCSLCGAWRGAYGLEPTPELYVQHTIEILREIRRVLRKDGVVFWNIGDRYASKVGGYSDTGSRGNTSVISKKTQAAVVKGKRIARGGNNPMSGTLKEKDLCLIPFRVAISAQTDGWWVRSVIIWNKPNPMPESVTDRPTESHEYILMLTKNARYYWNQEAVREPVAPSTIGRGPVDFGGAKGRNYQPDETDPNYRGGNEQWGRTYDYTQSSANGRNLRSVWSFPTQPYPEAHFAVFPEKLPELCIKAATPEIGCCAECGAPWERTLDKKETLPVVDYDGKVSGLEQNDGLRRMSGHLRAIRIKPGTHTSSFPQPATPGWQPTCKCNADKVPSIVLDPFAGAGTTLWVAKRLNRLAVGYELSSEYCDLALKRNRQQVMT